MDNLSKWAIKRIHRIENIQVDALAGITATLSIKEAVLLPIYFQTTSSIAATPICNTSETGVGWMDEIETYLGQGICLEKANKFIRSGCKLSASL